MRRRSEHAGQEDLILAATERQPVLALVPPWLEEPRGAHVMQGETAAEWARGAHVMRSQVPLGEPFGAHAIRREAVRDQLHGAHVKEGDPFLVVEQRALHASEAKPSATPELGTQRLEAVPVACGAPDQELEAGVLTSGREAAPGTRWRPRRTKRQGAHSGTTRRWGLVPITGAAAGALAAGLGGGAAFAFINSQGGGAGQTTAGSPVAAAVAATTGQADLLPGSAGTAYFTVHNAASAGATFDSVRSGATVVSDNTDLCANGDVTIARTLPYALPTPITVAPGGTSGEQSIADLVQLAPDAPGTCQGVTFTVTFTLSGASS